jgi:hypothetical protein
MSFLLELKIEAMKLVPVHVSLKKIPASKKEMPD